MAKIDISKIEGYDKMTPEEKLAALEGFEYEDNSAELERTKNALSKSNSEAAEWRKKHNALLSEEEKKKQEDAENLAQMQKELEALRKDKTVSEYTASLIAQGYAEALAKETATAMADGDTAKVFANQAKFIAEHDKALKAELLKGTPKPAGGEGGKGMTLDKLRTLSDEDYNKFATENPDEFAALYQEGE